MQNNFEKTVLTRTMNLNLSRMADPTVSINTLCTDIFLIIISMREERDLGTPNSLRKLLHHYINMFMQNCSEMAIDSRTAEAVKFALVALIDETVLSIPGECSTFWSSQSLQFEYYGEQIAGAIFYEDLQALMADPHTNYETLETYYYCLSLGFQGKYLDQAEEREKVIRQLASLLINTHKKNRTRKKKTPPLKKSSTILVIPTWWIISLAAVLILIIWISTSVSTRSFSKKTIQYLTTHNADAIDHHQ